MVYQNEYVHLLSNLNSKSLSFDKTQSAFTRLYRTTPNQNPNYTKKKNSGSSWTTQHSNCTKTVTMEPIWTWRPQFRSNRKNSKGSSQSKSKSKKSKFNCSTRLAPGYLVGYCPEWLITIKCTSQKKNQNFLLVLGRDPPCNQTFFYYKN